ncbi:MAG: RagB/SusD family nutrient uptake outer membrane protein [Niabella sp.]
MKRIQYIVLTMGIFVLISCQKNFLERYPLDAPSSPTFFKSENDLITYTNYFYSFLPGGADIYGEAADNIVKSSVSTEISGARQVPTTDSRWSWGDLRNINFLLTHPNVINYPDEAVRDKYMALAKFFRANFYFEKVRWYGDVPWYNTVLATNDNENLYKARDSRTLIMDSVLADIDFAIANLETSTSLERITKWTALALKSRICLYEGTWRKYHTEFNLPDADRFLEECVTASNELMSSGVYKVYTGTSGPTGLPYRDLFANLDINPVIDEVILARKYSNELSLKHGLQFYLTSRTQGKPGLEKRLVNSYLMSDGSRFTDITRYDTLQFFDEVQNRDPRLAQTIKTPGYIRIGETSPSSVDFESTMTGYQPIKWLNVSQWDGSGASIQDLSLFRFGEVLLNYAEAKAELGTLTQTDLDRSIHFLRNRVGMPDLDMVSANANPDPYQAALYTHVSGANKGVILEIRRERRIELVMENNLRWEDLMRWKEGHLLADPFKGTYFPGTGFYNLDQTGGAEIEIYAGTKPPATAGAYQLPVSDLDEGTKGHILTNRNISKTFNENRDYLWPLPINELSLNENLEQNPYWQQ